MIVGSLSLLIVPEDILLAFINVIPDPNPTKLLAVTIPVATILPVELNPTPLPPVVGFPPTWKLYSGLFVETPTFPEA